MVEYFVLVAIGLVALFLGGDSLVKGAGRLASALGIPTVIVGLTVVAFGTSVPELMVSISAATQGVSDIALGNVIGSNIANIGLILGVTAMILPLTIEWSLLRREVPIMIAVSALLLLLVLDGMLNQWDGLLLVLGFIAFTLFTVVSALRSRREMTQELSEFAEGEGFRPVSKINRWLELARLVGGIVLLILGAQWTVDGAVGVARAFQVSEFIIGVTLVALGTSLPELTTSVIGAFRKETDIVVGNVIGSNLTNILAILGLTSAVRPIAVSSEIVQFDLLVMILATLVLLPFLRHNVIQRWQGALLIIGYGVFIAFAVT